MHTVLLVEDDEFIQEMWKYSWAVLLANKPKIIFISAFSVKDAERKFFNQHDITCVVMDACVPGRKPNTPPLVKKIRVAFEGPIIAVSSDPEYQQILMSAGCSHRCEKNDLPAKLLEILGV